ncbi:thioredoxin family protein [Autumnicola musiva]|uniref:Thioredoxin fold domain-containing protein n=1 Tax=Autumnicola musiva TaxID=3075589 RepID=A0ABU3D8W5_9FLAO|nr:thioredoxin fold domain-containing protein [Zunongwangia sp. F117]MDT0677957.1 thioredoxin fold domain-containing protein [Zunongwangia sp. F117]
MKKITFLVYFLFIQLISFSQGTKFSKVDLDQAINKAKEENKYIFIDFYTNWCAPCKLMDRDVFPQEQVGNYFNEKFVSIKVNAEKEGVDLAKKYNIKAYPTFVILDENGNLVHLFAGGVLDGEKFIKKVDQSFNPEKAYGVLKKRYDSGKRDIELQSAYLQALINTHTIKPDSLVDVFYNGLSKEEKISEETLFVFEMFAPLDSERANFLETNRNKFRKVAGTKKVDSILRSKYESYFTKIVKGYAQDTSVRELEKIEEHVVSLGISNLKALPVFESGARLQLTKKGKEDFLKEVENTIPKLTNNEKDIMLYLIVPGLKKILSDKEKENLIAMVSDEDVKGYITRSIN